MWVNTQVSICVAADRCTSLGDGGTGTVKALITWFAEPSALDLLLRFTYSLTYINKELQPFGVLFNIFY